MHPLCLNSAGVVWVLLTYTLAQAALPPLDSSQLDSIAVAVVTGTVQSANLSTTVTRGPEPTQNVFSAVIEVDGLVKEHWRGAIQNGDRINVTYWRVGSTPAGSAGWVGHTGQRTLPRAGERGKFYLQQAAKRGWSLLEPNGWSRVPNQDRLVVCRAVTKAECHWLDEDLVPGEVLWR